MKCTICQAIVPSNYITCPSIASGKVCGGKLVKEVQAPLSDDDKEIVEEISAYVECGEFKAGELS